MKKILIVSYLCQLLLLTSNWALATTANQAKDESKSVNLANSSHTLKNGLQVVVVEDPRAPTVVQMLWYKVGSMDEVDGHSGLAHVLEHMMFKGTKKVASGEFSKIVAAAGGRENAFTSYDYTAYFQQIPKEKLELMMRLEADRLANLNFADKEFLTERDVVAEERRLRTDNNPIGKLFEAFRSQAFQAHPYRRPVIGWMDDIMNLSADDARNWYKTWYAPNNAVLVIVGDVKRQQVYNLAEQYYGKIPSKPLPVRRAIKEPEQSGLRQIEVAAPAENPMIYLGYKVPKLADLEKDNDAYALEILAHILDGYEGARLSSRLVRAEKVAQAVSAGYEGSVRGEALFYLSATPSKGKTVEEMPPLLKREINNIASEGVKANELNRARMQLIAGEIYKRDSMMGQAMEIGSMAMLGWSYQDNERIIAKLKQVSTQDVQRVAAKYFTDQYLTLGILRPLKNTAQTN